MENLRKSFSEARPVEELTTQQTLTLVGLAGLATLVIAVTPGLSLLNYPFRLLLTLVHELGHGLAALLTGGQFISFQIAADGSGLAYTAGGWRFVVIPAGYLGVALFGAILIRLGRNPRWSQIALGVIGAGILLLGLRYAVPTIFSSQILSGLLTAATSLIFGLLFLAVALKLPATWHVFLLHMLAIQAGLTAFSDLFAVIGLSTNFLNAPANDARSMAQLTFIPAIVWAVVWAVAALVLIGGAIWLTWLAPHSTSDKLPKRSRRR
jgi:hypothetical protein